MATKPGLGSIPSGLASAASDASNLSLGVDTSGVDAAKPALDSFVQSTESAARAADKLTASSVQQSKVLSEAKAFSASIIPVQAGYAKAVQDADEATKSFGTSSARARSEVVVLLHELSQDRVRQFAGSLLVMGEYLTAGQLAFSAMNVAVGLLAAPLALVTYGLIAGASAQSKFNKELLLTNNASGQTNDSVAELARGIAKSADVSITSSRDIINALIATGRVGPELLKPLGDAIARIQKLSGQSTEQIVKDFEKLIDSPTKWATSSTNAYNAVDVKLFEHIRFLEEHGQKDQAVLEASKAVSDHFANQLAPNIGYVEDRLKFLNQDMANLKEFLLSIGREKTFEDTLDQLYVKLNRLNALRAQSDKANTGIPGSSGAINEQQAQLTQEQIIVALQTEAATKRQAAQKAESDRIQRAGLESSEELHKIDERIKGSDRLTSALTKLAQNEANEVKAHVDAGDKEFQIDKKVHDARVAQLERDNIPQRVRGAVTNEDLVKLDVDKIKQQFTTIADAYKDVEAVFAAESAAGTVDVQQAFQIRAGFVQAESDVAILGFERQIAVMQKFNDANKNVVTESKHVSDNQKQITKDEEDIQRIRDKTGVQLTILTIQSKAYTENLNAGYLTAIRNAEELLRVTTQQHDQTLALFSLGDRDRSNETGIEAINERARAARASLEIQRESLEATNKFTDTEKQNYDTRLALINAFQETSLREWDSYYKRLTKIEDDWSAGANRVLQNYQDQAGFTAKNTEQLFTHAFSGMEDALTSFVTTGKLNFKSLITSFITDLTRLSIQQQLLKPFANFLQGIFTSGFGRPDGAGGIGLQEGASPLSITGPGGAIGADLGRGSNIPVLEKGPEVLSFNGQHILMMGDNTGSVTPGGYGPANNFNFNIASGVSRNELAALIPAMTEHIKAQLIAQMRRPGFSGV